MFSGVFGGLEFGDCSSVIFACCGGNVLKLELMCEKNIFVLGLIEAQRPL